MTDGFTWAEYYEAMRGRPPRKNLLAALDVRGDTPPGDAIDLGAGDGIDSIELARRGWQVTAIDADAGLSEHLRGVAGVTAKQRDFAQIDELPASDLLFAGFALPFCPPAHFETMWEAIRECLRPGAYLAVEFFGTGDEWAGRAGMTFHTRGQLERMLHGLDIVQLDEDERDGLSFDGPKHWHVFHVIARQPGQ